MKKLITALAVCAATSLSLAAETSVTSANVVGYNTLRISQPYTLIGLSFENTDSAGLPINEAFPFTQGNGMTPGTGVSLADQIQVRQTNGTGYTTYWLSCKPNATSNKWTSGAGTVVSTAVLEPGVAAWYISKTALVADPATHWNLVTKGQVLADATATRLIKAGIPSLISNPYPTDYNINSQDWVAMGAKPGTGVSVADQMQVRTAAGGYTTYWLSNKPNVTTNKWTTGAGTALPANPIIPAAQSAWYISRGAVDISWTVSTPLQ